MKTIIPVEKNSALRGVAAEVPLPQIRGKRIQNLIAEMKKLLSKEDSGVALAAPQIGESLRLFIVSGRALARDPRNTPDHHLEAPGSKLEAILPDQIYINPELIKMSRGRKPLHEGCLSIRGKWGTVLRSEKAIIRAYDEHGQLFTRGASGILAHIFQHEMDHLRGILYTDKAIIIYEEEKNHRNE